MDKNLIEIAKRLGVPYSTYHAWATGRRDPTPWIARLLRMADLGSQAVEELRAIRAAVASLTREVDGE